MEIGCTVATPLYCDACHVVEKSSCVWKLGPPSVPLYKHLKLSNAKIAGMEEDACALAFVSTQVLEETVSTAWWMGIGAVKGCGVHWSLGMLIFMHKV